ncbi:peptidase S28 [Conidiobolus coronatus NRRL 28638]|uniref:Peptidase S28 n=1 Tax=Conidiobolus coronatus (strain ATCC 28846 / CBS 209.66 / NRRL 28638) TaxID=796925 RepID=A0A137PHD6_CONC2|nr:peptidase S28 [Conidiobolus coronatus NRRL 28638]|eukprot:KXN74413.1 peptidase S28 [Conidiobolus coronatus NRRL 28638]
MLLKFLLVQAGLISANLNFPSRDIPFELADAAVNTTVVANQAAPGTVLDKWFDQVIDHDDDEDDDAQTYKQKYFVNTEFYKPGGPAFLYVGGEGALTNRSVSRGIIYEMAKEHNGILFGLEHRFYGESQPFKDLSWKSLKYLSTLNGVKDAGRFMKKVKNPLTGKALKKTKWITVGGSYPGSLSAWLRQEYPHLVFASLASSAPVLAKEDFFEYDQVVASALGPQCAKEVDAIRQYVDSTYGNKEQFQAIKTKFNCNDVEDDRLFLFTLADMLAGIIQYNSPTLKPNVESLCAGFANLTDIKEKFNYYADQLNLANKNNGQTCLDVSGIESIRNATLTTSGNMRQWTYQTCTEYGYWQTAPAQGISTRSKHLTVDWANEFYCSKELYGKKVGPPNNKYINRRFKALKNKTPRTIWVNGDADPWMALSVTDVSKSTPNRPIYIIKKGSHANDLGPDRPTDSASLTETRKAIRADITRWLSKKDY